MRQAVCLENNHWKRHNDRVDQAYNELLRTDTQSFPGGDDDGGRGERLQYEAWSIVRLFEEDAKLRWEVRAISRAAGKATSSSKGGRL